jgi:fatty-acid desaturase
MNKYQKAAALDLLKMTGIVVAVSLGMNILIAYFSAMEIITAAMVLLLAYTGYTLFNIRVDQHRTLDELNKDRK